MEAADALSPFPTAAADTLGGAGPALEGELLIRKQNGQGGPASGVKENRQTAGNRDATSAEQVGIPRQHPAPLLQHPWRKRLDLAARKRVNRQQGGGEAGR